MDELGVRDAEGSPPPLPASPKSESLALLNPSPLAHPRRVIATLGGASPGRRRHAPCSRTLYICVRTRDAAEAGADEIGRHRHKRLVSTIEDSVLVIGQWGWGEEPCLARSVIHA